MCRKTPYIGRLGLKAIEVALLGLEKLFSDN
jgi:hypothetical protein